MAIEGATRGDAVAAIALNDHVDALARLGGDHAGLVTILDRREVVRAALQLLASEGDLAWVAEPPPGTDQGELVLSHLHGARSGWLPGLRIPVGLGLTGKVHQAGRASWVDDYFTAGEITHTFDPHIQAEGVHRLLAVPLLGARAPFGVLALGVRRVGAFADRAVARAEAIAEEVALAVTVAERARLARVVAVHEERGRMAAELHDTVGALLFAIGSGVAGLAESAGSDPELGAALGRLQQHASDASLALRDSLRALRASPAALELAVALRADCSAFSDRAGIPAELVILDEDPPAPPPSRCAVLVAAVREALLNVEKHAGAEAVVVSAGRGPAGGLVVAVTDDGIGIPSPIPPGLGLTTSSEAVARIGGALTVQEAPEGGTTWRVELPC